MNEGGSKLQIATLVLSAAAALTALTMTCSNSRLEGQVISLRKAVEHGGTGAATSTASTAALEAEIAALRQAIEKGATLPAGGGGTTAGSPASGQVAGQPSGVEAVGWGGQRRAVTHVEGAAPNAPLRIRDKPRPQNDWYVQQWPSAAKTYNYYTTNEGECGQVVRGLILQPMIRVDPDRPPNVLPNLATSWSVSDDKLTYRYNLRKGVQFADGRPFTSADVRFSYDVIKDPEVGAAHLAPMYEDVESLDTPDEHTVIVRYKKPYWKGLYAFGVSLLVLNKGWYEEQIPVTAKLQKIEKFGTYPGQPGFGEVFRKMRLPCPGTGPYFLRDEADLTQDRSILHQNPFSWLMQVEPTWWNFTQVRRIYIKDPAQTDAAFLRGDFDIMSVAHDRWEDQLQNDPLIKQIANTYIYDHTGLDTAFFCWNTRKPPFDDARVRNAMAHLLDRKWMVATLYRGNGTIATCKSKRIYPTYSLDIVPHEFDVEKAKALLESAGWKDTDGDGLRDKGGKPFEFVMKGSSGGGPFGEQVTGKFADALKLAGVRMRYETSEWSTFIDDFNKFKFDGAFLSNSWPDPFIDNYESYHSSQDVENGGNSTGWHTPESDALLEKMREEFDEAKRTEMFHRWNHLYFAAQPELLFAHPLVRVCMSNRFQGVKVRPTGMQFFEFWVKPEDVRHR